MVRAVDLDLDLAPASLDLRASSSAVDEGGRLTLTCVARGAKPPAYVYWNSEPAMDLADATEEVTQAPDGTFETLNQLTFRAERRLTSLSCFASNRVIDDAGGVHLKRATTVNVKFRPEIHERIPAEEVRTEGRFQRYISRTMNYPLAKK